MSDAIRAILDAVTDRGSPTARRTRGEWAKRTERKVKRQRKNAEKADDQCAWGVIYIIPIMFTVCDIERIGDARL